jgi:hypothetical protein
MPKSESMPLCPFLLVVWLVSSGSRSAGSCVLVGRFFFFVVFLASALKYGFYRGEGKGGDRAILPTIKKKKKIKKRIAHQFWPLVFDNSLIRLASRVYYKAPSPSPSIIV